MLTWFLLCLRRAVAGGAFALFILLAHAGAAACEVRINEFMAAPGRDWDGNALFSARDDEWVELVNISESTLDFSEYVISDADSTWRWRGSGTLGPHEHRAVFGSEAVAWQNATGASIAGFSLANAGDTVRLWRISGTDTLLVESYGYRAHEAGTDRAIGRLPDTTGGFQLFDGLNPYTGVLVPQGNGCPPSPRSLNACSTTPAAPSSWGRIKATYR
ncbi:MAG: lamin tail domain-containing protein [Candidatus Eisenbacteria bacterium]